MSGLGRGSGFDYVPPESPSGETVDERARRLMFFRGRCADRDSSTPRRKLKRLEEREQAKAQQLADNLARTELI
eukprot:769248-Rhodomonas_salina.1